MAASCWNLKDTKTSLRNSNFSVGFVYNHDSTVYFRTVGSQYSVPCVWPKLHTSALHCTTEKQKHTHKSDICNTDRQDRDRIRHQHLALWCWPSSLQQDETSEHFSVWPKLAKRDMTRAGGDITTVSLQDGRWCCQNVYHQIYGNTSLFSVEW